MKSNAPFAGTSPEAINMSRGGYEGEQFLGKRLPVVTRNIIGGAKQDYERQKVQLDRQVATTRIVRDVSGDLWKNLGDSDESLERFLQQKVDYEDVYDHSKSLAFKAAFAVAYDLLRRQAETNFMEERQDYEITTEELNDVLPKFSITGQMMPDYFIFEGELQAKGNFAMGFDKNEALADEVWQLMEIAAGFYMPPQKYRTLTLQAVSILYGCLQRHK